MCFNIEFSCHTIANIIHGQYTLRYLHGSVDDWKKVLLSDKSTFQCMSSNE